jgi:hypothetical protein
VVASNAQKATFCVLFAPERGLSFFSPVPRSWFFNSSTAAQKIRWESRSYDTAAISAKAKGFAIFARPAAQQLLRQRLR